jgi:C-terminal processing protease CtpA/Prc
MNIYNNPILKRKGFKIIIIVAISLLTLVAVLFTYYKACLDPYRETINQPSLTLDLSQTLTRNQALEDLSYVKEQIEKYHPAYLDHSGRYDKVEEQYQKEIASLSDNTTVVELWKMAGRIAARLQDGHTGVSVYHSTEDYFISDFRQLKDYGNPIAINGEPIDNVYQVFLSQFSYELEAYAKFMFEHVAIANKNYLSFCGVDTSEGVVFTFASDQEKIDYHYEFVPIDQVIGYEEEEDNGWVSYDIEKERNLAVFTLKQCNYNKEYSSTLQSFFNEVNENNIENLVIDLRNNPGGNSLVANSFIEYLDVDTYQTWDSAIRFGWYLMKITDITCENQKKEPTFKGKIFVLTNTRTYSSAMDFAMLIKDNQLGVIVGEPSGNLPDSYGDILGFQLPNSKIFLNVSYKKWYRIDKTKAAEPLTPDYEVASKDALDKVYDLIK